MTMNASLAGEGLTGLHLIAGNWVGGGETFLSAPAKGEPMRFASGGAAEIDAAARAAEDEAFLFDEYLENTRTLAAICRSKYRTVTVALRALLCTVIAYAALLAIPG